MIRRATAAALFIGIVAVGMQPTLLSFPFISRARFAAGYATALDQRAPGYREFLEAVREHTHNGDSIAVLVPYRKWEYGYSYAYYRASYVLAGREVLPLVSEKDEMVPANFSAAQYVAAWKVAPPAGDVIARAGGGVLVKHR